MEEELKLDIGNIYIIVEKSDNKRFVYNCEQREWDGFVYLANGNGFFSDSKGRKFPIKDSSLILLNANEKYTFEIEAGYSYITSAFDWKDTSPSVLSSMPKVLDCNPEQRTLIEYLCRRWQIHQCDSYMKCKISLLELYLGIVKSVLDISASSDSVVKRATEFIHNNFKRNFTSEEIAKYCSVSISHLRMKFRSSLNMSITDYRDSLRVNSAREMLSSHLFTPKETAYELGYCDIYHFTKTFKKLAGVSPAKFAKKYN